MAKSPEEIRAKYIEAYNKTMVEIWKERIMLTNAYDTGALFNSVASVGVKHDAEYRIVEITHNYLRYGAYVEAGVGRNTWKGNPGDIGRDNPRKKRKIFRMTFYRSLHRLREFLAFNLGAEFGSVVRSAWC